MYVDQLTAKCIEKGHMGRGDFHKCDEPLTMHGARIMHPIKFNSKKFILHVLYDCFVCLFPLSID